jgi:hypothetical protein
MEMAHAGFAGRGTRRPMGGELGGRWLRGRILSGSCAAKALLHLLDRSLFIEELYRDYCLARLQEMRKYELSH